MENENKKIEIVGMIYKSLNYLKFMMYNIEKYCLNGNSLNINYKIIANDASNKVINYLEKKNINFYNYKDRIPDDYYMNRIYRAWNFGGMNSKADIIVFINSDMAFTNNWIHNLIKNLNSETIPCSRLIESTKLRSGKHAIEKNFGQSPQEFKETEFIKYANSINENKIEEGGLYMPCTFYVKDFIESGGYPEGNIYQGGVGAYKTPGLLSGDYYYFYNNKFMKQKKHITVFDSVVYHIQTGEIDENEI